MACAIERAAKALVLIDKDVLADADNVRVRSDQMKQRQFRMKRVRRATHENGVRAAVDDSDSASTTGIASVAWLYLNTPYEGGAC
jgi:hypothetical protein